MYLVSSNKHTQMPTCLIGQRYRKPAIMVKHVSDLRARDVVAFFRARGMQGYAPYNLEELGSLLPLFWAQKVFRQTNITYITTNAAPPPSAAV